MKKTAISITAAMFAMTALSSPARADGDAIRLGVGIGALIINEIAKGAGKGGNRRGGKVEGRVDGRGKPQTRQTAKGKTKAVAPAAAVVAAVTLPEVGPLPEAKPTPEQVAAWVEQMRNEDQAALELAHGESEGIDPSVTAATVEAVQADQSAPEEAATVEMFDEQNRYWGKVTPTEAAKIWDMVGLGMKASEAFPVFPSLKLQIAEAVEPEGVDLIDEDGKLWGNVSEAVADKVWKAVDMGMKPSQAFAALSGLQHPDEVARIAAEEAKKKEAKDAKTLAFCLERATWSVKWTECRPYEAQMAEVRAKAEAEEKAARAEAERIANETRLEREKRLKDEADAKAFAEMLGGDKPETAPIVEEEKPAVAEIAPVVEVDDKATTAAVEKAPEAEAKAETPAEKPKTKLDIDL